jgi:hypothetical protein
MTLPQVIFILYKFLKKGDPTHRGFARWIRAHYGYIADSTAKAWLTERQGQPWARLEPKGKQDILFPALLDLLMEIRGKVLPPEIRETVETATATISFPDRFLHVLDLMNEIIEKPPGMPQCRYKERNFQYYRKVGNSWLTYIHGTYSCLSDTIPKEMGQIIMNRSRKYARKLNRNLDIYLVIQPSSGKKHFLPIYFSYKCTHQQHVELIQKLTSLPVSNMTPREWVNTIAEAITSLKIGRNIGYRYVWEWRKSDACMKAFQIMTSPEGIVDLRPEEFEIPEKKPEITKLNSDSQTALLWGIETVYFKIMAGDVELTEGETP